MYQFKSWVVVAVAATALGCATETRSRHLAAYETRGPGTVFPTIEMAAIDGLAYSYKAGEQIRREHRARGGTIIRVEGGYTYAEREVAHHAAPMQLTYRLGPEDVAHFRVYPRTHDNHLNRSNERVSRIDRHVVDLTDPAHRPLYVLTPKLMVREYRGQQQGVTEIVDLGASDLSEALAAREP